ncbi:P-loop containing nucleoside triphosphate hydrolase protein [Annulohypoxylon maeteangense]|uniref:P-loop containing nucleoside triphosphate hydrolase protein n=1 Tax=Annulohypoxylon maeteangense TaxID=1927788 RepID=UPI002008874E|nr:P-loop containing nucleoside triphosphate hydrolase protein [Annulohypoxylon maeteangense]KAI0884418.1 P-loop containing nucleoside triphosphate hydrolase protein [Annulohypoxylon maeteangense]
MPKFVPRQRKHRVLARIKAQQEATRDGGAASSENDSNALEILPDAQKQVREAKRAQLREELNGEVKVSGKKAKRLEKYIDSKLKKDENRVLLAELAKNKIDTSLFSSSRTLGQGKETKRQAISRVLRERQAGINQGDDDVLFEARRVPASDESDDDGEVHSKSNRSMERNGALLDKTALITNDLNASGDNGTPHEKPAVSVGSGLKRPLELDDEGRPVIKKRQKRGGVKSKISTKTEPLQPEPTPGDSDEQLDSDGDGDGDGDEWNGFDSVASAHDSADSQDSSKESEDESSDEESGSEEESSEEEGSSNKRSSAFKAWAHGQRNAALGYQPVDSSNSILNITVPKNFKPRPLEQDPLPLELLPTKDNDRKAFSVSVQRTPEIQEARLKLPVVAEEQKIMEAIHNNNVVLICGATGSGKTTQVPQFLFEAGYGSPNSPTPGLIGVTQPRKVAAVSMSKRVGQELGDQLETVAYQIRFEGTVNEKTAVKFMTDGVLLREVANDIALRKYSAVIIDEAHERSVNTDILIGMLSRVVKLREDMSREDPKITPLKLIIMSATLRVDDFVKNKTLFPIPPPVLNVEGRQHPVTMHFSRHTRHDYVDEAFKKIMRGHRKLPPGSFLVFLTGHDEIQRLSKKLRAETGALNTIAYPKVRISANDVPLEVEDIDFGETNETANDDNGLPFIDDYEEDESEDDAEFDVSDEVGSGPLKMHILPLYSLLPTREQMRVFDDPPEGSRAIILATNIAETSLTIPGIRYVFDSGRSKERKYNRDTGVQSYEISWISKASANQRAGRAGRTGPGHCYRLYSSAVFERDFSEFADPELLRMPIEGVVLQLKAMRLQHVVNFPFPTPPDRMSLKKAEKLLQYLSAITETGQATQIGTTMAKFPLPPRFARILLIGHLHECLPYTVALVAGLSVAQVFIPENQVIPTLSTDSEHDFRTNQDVAAENQKTQMRRKYNEVHRNFCSLDDSSDAMKLLQAVGEFAHDPTEQWCKDHFVLFKSLQETQKLRHQLTSLLQKDIPAFANLVFQNKLDRPSAKQVTALKQMVAAGFVDQVAIRADLAPTPPELHRKPRRAIDVPYIPLQPTDPSSRDPLDSLVYIHPTSCLSHRSPQECPEFIIYSNLQRASPSSSSSSNPKTRMLALTDVSGAQLAGIAKGTPLLTYGKPIKEVVKSATTRECWVVPYLRAEGTGGLGWPLPVKRILQKRVVGKGWVTE